LTPVVCSCCGQERDDSIVAGFAFDDRVKICRYCLEWQLSHVGATATATLPVADMDEAVAFYESAGFGVRVYRPDDQTDGGGFAFVDLDGQSVFDLDLVEDLATRSNAAGCYIITADIEEWHRRLEAAGLPVTPVRDEPWGMREFAFNDPSGNCIRIGRSSST
jgi:catechol 2,3-dioxygenase-like lactoylglutathione lyase family enzyme